MFCCHKCNHNALMKEARGQNKLFQNASLLMCCCSFAIGHFLVLKNQSKRQAIESLFKVQISLDHPSSNTNCSGDFTYILLFVNFTMLSMEFPIRNCLPFFLPNPWEFLPDYLVTYSGQKSPQIADKKKSKCHLR